jgi:2-polyprenyl-3-methyl-5-hydroxy-6-metoxy-1,4-benzoquinol methylase
MYGSIRTLAAPACSLCGSTGRILHGGLTDRILASPGVWSLRGCDACQVVWLDPRPVAADIGALYEGSYMTHDGAAAAPTIPAITRAFLRVAYGYGEAVASRPWLRRLPAIDDILGGAVAWLPAVANGRLLDFGCGSGEFLARMHSLGWRVTGVEPDPAAAALASAKPGLTVAPDLETLAGPDFDAVTMHHVIEHLPDPPRTLAVLSARLTRGGRLVVVTPNVDSMGRRRFGASWVHWDPPRHLQLYALSALVAEVERAGFVPERAWTTGRYARFVGTESPNIKRVGRVGSAAPRLRRRLSGIAFQLVEQALGPALPTLGEELVVVARKP